MAIGRIDSCRYLRGLYILKFGQWFLGTQWRNTLWMFSMEILSIFLLTLSLTAAQYLPRGPNLRNPGFRNVQTQLETAAARNRPFISIPIVLLPDGQTLPKPKHATYHYIGHATPNGPRSNNQRGNKPREQMGGKASSNYQVAIPSQQPSTQQKKVAKPPKLTATQLNGHIRNVQNIPKHRGHSQNSQQNQPQKPPQTFEQNQQLHQIQYVKQQQRNPTFQQQGQQQTQQAASTHKQNVANFVNFAANIGAAVVAQQQNHPVILPTQAPNGGVSFQNHPNHKTQESILNQKSLLSNHKLNNGGVIFQHQVPSLQTTQTHYAQVLQGNLANHNNGFNTQHQQHSQQTQSSPQPQQQQEQTQTSPAPESQYLPASNIRSVSQSSQGSEQNNVQYSSNQGSIYQQNTGNNLRAQNGQSNVVLLNNYNGQLQQNNQQSYATSPTPQQPTPAPQVVANYDSQTQLPKNSLSGQQSTSSTGYSVNPQTSQSSYINHNQATQQQQQNYNLNTQGQQVIFPNNAQTSSISYPTSEVSQANVFSVQNTQANGGHTSDPLSYFHYQTAQELPLSYASLFNQGQTSYISSTQNTQQNDPLSPSLEQSYTILPNSHSVFASSSIPTIFVSSQQDESSSSSSASESGIQTYDSYSNDQSSYQPSSSQANQASYTSTSNVDKGYPVSQYSYLQSSADGQTSPSGESQVSQSSSSDDSGQLVYTSSSSKQISYPQSQSSYSSSPQQYGSSSYQSSPTYISFSTANSNYKSEAQTPLTYTQRAPGVVTPGSTYTKANQENAKEPKASEATENSEDSEYEEDEESEDEEASYKVVYIPLDILKNILSNSVENQ